MITTNRTTTARLLVGVGALAMSLPLHAQQAVQAPPAATATERSPGACQGRAGEDGRRCRPAESPVVLARSDCSAP